MRPQAQAVRSLALLVKALRLTEDRLRRCARCSREGLSDSMVEFMLTGRWPRDDKGEVLLATCWGVHEDGRRIGGHLAPASILADWQRRGGVGLPWANGSPDAAGRWTRRDHERPVRSIIPASCRRTFRSAAEAIGPIGAGAVAVPHHCGQFSMLDMVAHRRAARAGRGVGGPGHRGLRSRGDVGLDDEPGHRGGAVGGGPSAEQRSAKTIQDWRQRFGIDQVRPARITRSWRVWRLTGAS